MSKYILTSQAAVTESVTVTIAHPALHFRAERSPPPPLLRPQGPCHEPHVVLKGGGGLRMSEVRVRTRSLDPMVLQRPFLSSRARQNRGVHFRRIQASTPPCGAPLPHCLHSCRHTAALSLILSLSHSLVMSVSRTASFRQSLWMHPSLSRVCRVTTRTSHAAWRARRPRL